jgi:hypothetical protein
MALNARQRQAAMAWYLQQPKPGAGVDAQAWEKIAPVANSITLPLWGRPAHPEQIRWLADHDMTEPSQIHGAFGQLPHPHAPSISVADYPKYTHAMQVYEDHK